MEYILAIVVALVTSLVGPIVVEWFKSKNNKKSKDPLPEALEHNSLIDHQLDEIIENIKCDRIWIAQFHNGGHFYPTGKSIQKFSIFYEVLSLNASSIIETYQNIPVSLFNKCIGTLFKEDILSFNITDESKSNIDQHMIDYKMDTQYLFSIRNLEGKFIGMMGIAYNDAHKMNKNDYNFINNKIGAIGLLLNDYLKK